jgi:hypothetical protein
MSKKQMAVEAPGSDPDVIFGSRGKATHYFKGVLSFLILLS